MPAPPSSSLRRALAALLVVVVVASVGDAALAAPGPPEQVPSTEPGGASVPATAPSGGATTGPADPEPGDVRGDGDGLTSEDREAQDRADADLWAVWQVVIALVGVMVALIALLLVYARATSPRRRTARALASSVGAAVGDEVVVEEEEAADESIPDTQVLPVVEEVPPAEDPEEGEALVPVVAGGAWSPEARSRQHVPVSKPAPGPRARRVTAPAKKLATPDAERVLVRPGRAPIRVPRISDGRTDGPPPPAPPPSPSPPASSEGR